MEIFSSEFFGNLVVFGLTTATGCVAYFAKQIMANNRDLFAMHNDLKRLSKQAEDLKARIADVEMKIDDHQEEQNNAEQAISNELSRLSTMVDMYYKSWDGSERRSSS